MKSYSLSTTYLAITTLITNLCLLISATNYNNDQTTCMTDFIEGDDLHFVCYCLQNYQDQVAKHAKIILNQPGFSLAHFTYNLAGSYFGKNVHIQFEGCRHLKLVLDHMELSRIGSSFFRPDIQVRGLILDQIYHVELLRNPPRSQQQFEDEYLIASPAQSLIIDLSAVALVKVDAAAEFARMQTASQNTRLYIDLNQGKSGDEDDLNVVGFVPGNIFFVTNSRKIPLKEASPFLL